MNKQEAIEKIKNIDTLNINDAIAGQQVDMVIKNQVLDLVSQIDEPQKVVVPKFVAEWLKEYRYANTLLKVLNAAEDERIITSAVNDWILDNQRDFVVAWYDGYEVEQEKLYTVEIPNNGGTLVLASIHHAIKLVDSNKHFPGKFTKESIEYAGFGWVFDCSGVKVKELEG
ncbi:DUF1642 domain-containing protein [Streptococcus suis]|uniref:DUF1642 domain-containing protein n=1 Tax=Streptococcus suis TaxID=1307 RepID=UPI0025B0EBDC|nr:DUF1642 domain-containing protein [Streptococcus suis]MDN2998984.1 DUF1642 domain-containing protein [Streptococcus suis]